MRKVVGTLNSTLEALGEYIAGDVPPTFWRSYAHEDHHTGWDFGAGDWPVGSLHTAEGKTLYTLVRALGVSAVVECGSLYGCSSTHIAQALKDTDVSIFKLVSVDILEGTGNLMPDDLKPYRTQLYMKGEDYLNSLDDNSVDMVYEDTDHYFETTRDIWLAAIQKVRSGGVIVSHDSEHATAGKAVTDAVIAALGHDNFLTLLVPPADCGLLVWVKP